MTNAELLLRDGYISFQAVMPEDLLRRCVDEINGNPNERWDWDSPLASEFREWFRSFMETTELSIWGESSLNVFNRHRGGYMWWHSDGAGGNPAYGRRVFCCAYMTPTFGGGGLKVIPGSQTGKGYDGLKARQAEFIADPIHQMIQDPNNPDSMMHNPEKGNILPLLYPDLHPDFCHMDGEAYLDVPAGTVVIADERIWHAVAVNRRENRRVMVMWWRWKPVIGVDG